MASEAVEVHGHLMDTGLLALVLDDVLGYGGDYRIDRLDVGRAHEDESHAQITVSADDDEGLQRLLMRLQTHGVNMVDPGEALLRTVDRDGVFPDDFYSTTNLETVVRLGGSWVPVEQPEMDCGLVEHAPGRLRTIPVSDVKAGDRVVCGAGGVKVVLPQREHSAHEGAFEFMQSSVSSEKPQALLVRQIAQRLREVKAEGLKILWVGGPAVVHTGRGAGDGRAGRGGLRRRALRRQRAGDPRHRVLAVRHLARRRPGHGQGRRARPRAPHPGHQHRPPRRVDPRGGRAGRADRRGHARDGQGRAALRPRRLGARRRARCPTCTPT